MDNNINIESFTEKQKQEIFRRDGYRCVMCGRGLKDGIELHINYIKQKNKGGKATIENGQTLCSIHNFQSKDSLKTENPQQMFIRLYEKAKSINDIETMNFCAEILEVFEKNNVNGHIEWKKQVKVLDYFRGHQETLLLVAL